LWRDDRSKQLEKNEDKLVAALLMNGRARVSFGGYSLRHDKERSKREGGTLG
jgi:hypothetical protein